MDHTNQKGGMDMDFKHSETKDNLMRAFAGESQARNRYTFAAEQAKEQAEQDKFRDFLQGRIFQYIPLDRPCGASDRIHP